MNKVSKRLILISAALFLMAALSGCSGDGDSSQANAETQVKTNSKSAPLFSVKDADGSWRSGDEWLGKQAVVINFWGTWCPPCRREIPDLVKLNDEFSPKGVALISVAVNDSPSKVKQYAANNDMDWVMLMAEDQVLIDYRVTTGIPTTIFIDKEGNEVARFIGMRDYATLRKGFEAIAGAS